MAWFIKSSRQRMTRLHLEALHLRVTVLEKQMALIDDLTAKVQQQDSVIQSAITLINGIKDRLANVGSGGDAQKVLALMQELDQNTGALASAVAANTPAAGSTAPAGEPPTQPAAPDATQQQPADDTTQQQTTQSTTGA